MTEDIPDNDFETKTSKTVSQYVSNTSGWDIGEFLLILGLVVSGGGVILGDLSLVPVFAVLAFIWYTVAKVADTRIDERVDLTETGKSHEVTRENHYSGECTAEGEDEIKCGGQYTTVRSYNVFRIGGHEVWRQIETENTYCANHYAIEHPADSERDIEHVLEEAQEETDEELELRSA